MTATNGAPILPPPTFESCPECENVLHVVAMEKHQESESVGIIDFSCEEGHRFRWRFIEHSGCIVVESTSLPAREPYWWMPEREIG